MIGTSYIAQLEKQYKVYLRNIVENKAFDIIILRGGKINLRIPFNYTK